METNIWNSWSPKVLLSWPPSHLVELVVLPQLLAPLLVVLLPLRRRPRRRKRVGFVSPSSQLSLTISIEKEESDEDMGFGLFD
jgi:hypothetical protein